MEKLLSILKPIELLKLKLRYLYESKGYRKYTMSRFEEYGLYLENRNFLINDAVITFTDLDGRLLALKPDVTLSIVKHSTDFEQRLYYTENVYRPDRAKRSFKEIEQVGLERIGALDDDSVAEVVSLAAQSLKIVSVDSLLEISHCGFVKGLLSTVTNDFDVRAKLLKAIEEKNVHGLTDVAVSAGVEEKYISILQSVVFLSGDFDDIISAASGLCVCEEMKNALDDLALLNERLKSVNDLCEIKVDLSLVGAEDYYNGVVFSGYIKGLPFRVLSGGRYDALLKRFGRQSGALGFAIYLDDLDALSVTQRIDDSKEG